MDFQLFKQNHELQEKIDELQQLAELSRQQNDQIRLNTQKTETSRFEAEIRELKLQLAGAIANNVELDEIRKENEERLKVELTASQSLYKNATEEIAKLKMQTETAKEDLNRAKHLVEKYREELDIVGAQVCFLIKKFKNTLNMGVEKPFISCFLTFHTFSSDIPF